MCFLQATRLTDCTIFRSVSAISPSLARESIGIRLIRRSVHALEIFLNRDLQDELIGRKVIMEADRFAVSPILYLCQRSCYANHAFLERGQGLATSTRFEYIPEMRAIRENYILFDRFTGGESVNLASIHA